MSVFFSNEWEITIAFQGADYQNPVCEEVHRK